MTVLQDVWAIERDSSLDPETRADILAAAKAPAWLDLVLPITVGSLTVISCSIIGRVVKFEGTGGSLSWPLELVSHPVGILDESGDEMDPEGLRWRLDPLTVLIRVLEMLQ